MKASVVTNQKTEGILTVLNDAILFKMVFKQNETPFTIQNHELFIWKGTGDEDFCDAESQELVDESGALLDDPIIKQERNPSNHLNGVQDPNLITI